LRQNDTAQAVLVQAPAPQHWIPGFQYAISKSLKKCLGQDIFKGVLTRVYVRVHFQVHFHFCVRDCGRVHFLCSCNLTGGDTKRGREKMENDEEKLRKGKEKEETEKNKRKWEVEG
jgi:hypothetical protein